MRTCDHCGKQIKDLGPSESGAMLCPDGEIVRHGFCYGGYGSTKFDGQYARIGLPDGEYCYECLDSHVVSLLKVRAHGFIFEDVFGQMYYAPHTLGEPNYSQFCTVVFMKTSLSPLELGDSGLKNAVEAYSHCLAEEGPQGRDSLGLRERFKDIEGFTAFADALDKLHENMKQVKNESA